jgi:hypothetical protein
MASPRRRLLDRFQGLGCGDLPFSGWLDAHDAVRATMNGTLCPPKLHEGPALTGPSRLNRVPRQRLTTRPELFRPDFDISEMRKFLSDASRETEFSVSPEIVSPIRVTRGSETDTRERKEHQDAQPPR